MTSVAAQSNGHRKAQVQDLPLGEPQAQACQRGRGREDNTAPAVTVGDLPLKRRRWLGAVPGLLAGGSLLHARPASLAEAHERHLHAAGAFSVRSLRWPRLAWAYLIHLPVKIVTHTLDWVTESPARAFIAALVILAAWHWG
jgi:hypothetical protein